MFNALKRINFCFSSVLIKERKFQILMMMQKLYSSMLYGELMACKQEHNKLKLSSSWRLYNPPGLDLELLDWVDVDCVGGVEGERPGGGFTYDGYICLGTLKAVLSLVSDFV